MDKQRIQDNLKRRFLFHAFIDDLKGISCFLVESCYIFWRRHSEDTGGAITMPNRFPTPHKNFFVFFRSPFEFLKIESLFRLKFIVCIVETPYRAN